MEILPAPAFGTLPSVPLSSCLRRFANPLDALFGNTPLFYALPGGSEKKPTATVVYIVRGSMNERAALKKPHAERMGLEISVYIRYNINIITDIDSG